MLIRILIYGGGWIGNMLKEYLKCDLYDGKVIPYGIHYTNESDRIKNYDVVINTIAYTDIDWCEKNKLQAYKSNIEVAIFLAEICRQLGKKFIHFSSACVFDSSSDLIPKCEDDPPNPKCFYTETKVMAEKLIQEINPDSLIIRLRVPISESKHPRNLLDKLVGYKKLTNSPNSVTVIEDMFPVLRQLIQYKAKGVYHLVNDGYITPAEIGTKLGIKFDIINKNQLDEILRENGKTNRVDSLISSKKIDLLPNIHNRIDDIINKWRIS